MRRGGPRRAQQWRLDVLRDPKRPRRITTASFPGRELDLNPIGPVRVLTFPDPPPERPGTAAVVAHDLRRKGTAVRRGRLGPRPPGRRGELAYLPSRGMAAFTGLDVLRAPADRCPGPRRGALNRRDVRPGDPYQLRCPFAEVRVAFAVALDATGRPRPAGRCVHQDGFTALLPVGDLIAAYKGTSSSCSTRKACGRSGRPAYAAECPSICGSSRALSKTPRGIQPQHQ